MKTTTAISTVKRDVQLQEWTEQIKAQQESGMTVTAYLEKYIVYRHAAIANYYFNYKSIDFYEGQEV